MRKQIIEKAPLNDEPYKEPWLDLEALAMVEVTSEDPANPIECALLPGQKEGWLASESGEQTIRLVFMHPQRVNRVFLRFVEPHNERTQEYLLRWSPDIGAPLREIVRQQYNFSPQSSTTEIETHLVELANVTILELTINPDINGKPVNASLQTLRLA